MNYQNIYNIIINNSKSRSLDCYTEKHHIIPRCLGGNNKKENIATLTPKEHYICHRLLIKIYKGQDRYKMIYAMNRLLNRYSNNSIIKINSRSYSKLKELHASTMSNRVVSLETRRKISNYRIGQKHTKETKDKLSKALKGKKKSVEWKEKISIAHLNKPKSIEACNKVSSYWKNLLKDRPWKNSRANQSVWALAKDVYQLRKEKVSMAKIAKQLNIPYSNLINMGKKINQGWNPNTDKCWIKDFKS